MCTSMGDVCLAKLNGAAPRCLETYGIRAWNDPLQVILLWGLGGGIGVMGGGALGQVLYNRSQPAMPIFIGCCTMLGSLPMWWLINVRLDRLPIFLSYLGGFLGGVFSAPPGPNVR